GCRPHTTGGRRLQVPLCREEPDSCDRRGVRLESCPLWWLSVGCPEQPDQADRPQVSAVPTTLPGNPHPRPPRPVDPIGGRNHRPGQYPTEDPRRPSSPDQRKGKNTGLLPCVRVSHTR